MNAKRKLAFSVLLILISFSIVSAAFASSFGAIEIYYKKYDLMASDLRELHLFRSNENGFDLDREPSRLEGAVMLVRLLGAEKTAIEKKYSHPFKDVPAWGNSYVGYLYHNKLVMGKSSDTFGSNDKLLATQYITMVLRALGYTENVDFVWDKSETIAYNLGLVDYVELNRIRNKKFTRDSMVFISHRAIQANIKNTDVQLISKLIDSGIVNRNEAINMDIYDIYREEGTGVTISGLKPGEKKRLLSDKFLAIYFRQ